MTYVRWMLMVLSATITVAAAVPAAAEQQHETVTLAFSHAVPNMPGKSVTAVFVDYPPGAASLPHRHAPTAFVYAYVLSGTIESQVDDGPVRVLHAGESFYEAPGSRHPVSRNASSSEPARLLAVFLVDTVDKKLTVPLK